MEYNITYNGYSDRRLYEPLELMKKALNLRVISHEDHSDTDYPMNRNWSDIFLVGGGDAILRVTTYPESEYVGYYGTGKMIAKYIIHIEPIGKNAKNKENTASTKIDRIIEELMGKL